MDGIDVLKEYLLVFKEVEKKNENNERSIKEIDKLISLLDAAKTRTKEIKYIDNYDLIEKIILRYDANKIKEEIALKIKNNYNLSLDDDIKNNNEIPSFLKEMLNSSTKGIENVLFDIMLNVNRYNLYFMNKKSKSYIIPISSDIKFDELDVELKDILSYLEVEENDIDNKLLFDITKYIKEDKGNNLEKLKEFAIELKMGSGLKKALYDRIIDKSVLLAILLHSNLTIVNSIQKYFESKNIKNNDINKVVGSIPSIFMKSPINSKCKFSCSMHYNDFVNNLNLLEKHSIDLKFMVNHPIFLINDFNKNIELVGRLEGLGINIKNILVHIGNIFVMRPDVVFNNINTLSLYGIKLTNDNNNNGYTLLGMEDLADRLDYLIEKGLWKKTDGNNLDNIDLIRGLIIKDDYLKWKNNYKCDTLDSTSLASDFTNEPFNDNKLTQTLETESLKVIIDSFDNTYWDKCEVYYAVGLNRISRPRILRNLCNYKGRGNIIEMLEKVIKHKSNNINSEEVIKAIIGTLEMGDESVKLFKGL